jgi:hypothetical protein
MSEILEFLFDLLTNRLGLFILGVCFVVGGYYGWKEFRHNVRQYDAAVSQEGRTVEARVAWKNREQSGSDSHRDDGGSTYDYYLKLEFETENGLQEAKVYVDTVEYDSVDLGKTIQVKFHPENPQYVVTPKMERPSTWLANIGFGFCIFLGVIICLAVIISLF